MVNNHKLIAACLVSGLYFLSFSSNALADFPVFQFDSRAFPLLTPQQTSPLGGVLSDATAKRAAMAEVEELELRNKYMKEQMAREEQLEMQSQIKIMVFSQTKHNTYLGCLNCSEYIEDSMHNPESRFSSRIAKTSIFNSHSQHGSINSDLSPCNPYAKHPPIVIDNNDTVYGLLTLNTKLQKGIKVPVVTQWLEQVVCIK
jgi:hypothetical protein